MASTLTSSDWVLTAAAFFGPIAAVQAQKWLERARERDGRKDLVFATLLANRRARLSPQFVQALNAIDVAFYGNMILGRFRWQSEAEKAVVSRWRTLLTHQTPDPPMETNDARIPAWNAAGDELFWNLLESMARCLRYDFDRETLKRGGYLPEGHAIAELQSNAMRQATLRILQGDPPLRVIVVEQPPPVMPQFNRPAQEREP